MNVGVADPALADLAWKLEAILKGYRAVACDVTGGVASLNFDATELRIFMVILEAQVTQICSMNILRLITDFIKISKVWFLSMEFYGAW